MLVTGGDWPPYADPSLPNGGLLPDIALSALTVGLGQDAAQSLMLVHLPWQEAVDGADEGLFSALVGQITTIEEFDGAAASGASDDPLLRSRPLATIETALISHPDQAFDWTGISTLRGLGLCHPESTPLPPLFADAVEDGWLDEVHPGRFADCVALVATDPDIITVAEPRRVAAALTTAGLGLFDIHISALPVGTFSLRIGFPRNRPDSQMLLSALEAGLTQMTRDGTLAALYDRHWQAPSVPEGQQRLLFYGHPARGQPPYSLPTGANRGGFITELLIALGEESGHGFHRVYGAAQRDWALVTTGQLDVAAPFNPDWRAGGAGDMLLSVPILDSRDVLVTRSDHLDALNAASSPLDALAGEEVAITMGYRYAGIDRSVELSAGDEGQLLDLIATGRVRAGIMEERVAWMMLQQARRLRTAGLLPEGTDLVIGPPVAEGRLHLLLNPKHADILPDLNAALHRMEENGTLAALRDRWLYRPLGQPPPPGVPVPPTPHLR